MPDANTELETAKEFIREAKVAAVRVRTAGKSPEITIGNIVKSLDNLTSVVEAILA
jgi:hypothetical protein